MKLSIDLSPAQAERLRFEQERVMLDLAGGRIDRGQLSDWLRQHLKPLA